MRGRGNRTSMAFPAAPQTPRSRVHSNSSRTKTLCTGFVGRLVRGEGAQALIMTAMAFTVVMGGTGVCVDVGYLHYEQRLLQTAADAAAIAAGMELGSCSKSVCGVMTTAAEQALVEDGMVGSTSSVTETQNSSSSSTSCSIPSAPSSGVALQINVSPCALSGDPNNGNVNMAEVVLVEKKDTFFSGMFGLSHATIVARAEAGDAWIKTYGGGECIYTKGMQMSSNAHLDLTNCGIYDSGNLETDANSEATATDFLYYGSWSPNKCHSNDGGLTYNNCSFTLGDGETQPTLTTTQRADPYLNTFTAPSVPSGPPNTNVTFSSNQTNSLSPGYYQGDVTVSSNVTINLSPGLYYFDGNFIINSNSTIECTACTNGAGVTFYFNTGSWQESSNATVNLTAPSTGNALSGNAIPNLLYWEPTSNTSNMTLDSNSLSSYVGIIYLPNQTLTMNSNSSLNGSSTSQTLPTVLDVNDLVLNSNQELTITAGQNLPNSSTSERLGTFALAE